MPEPDPIQSDSETRMSLEELVFARVLIDPRVLAEVTRKKPIGVSRTGWVNLLLQRAIATEPEPLARD